MIADIQNNLNMLSYSFRGGDQSRANLPVAPNELIYANFSHVSGVATDGKDSPRVSLNDMQMLNAILSSIERIKGKPVDEKVEGVHLSSSEIGELIKKYSAELHNLVVAADDPKVQYSSPQIQRAHEQSQGKIISLLQ